MRFFKKSPPPANPGKPSPQVNLYSANKLRAAGNLDGALGQYTQIINEMPKGNGLAEAYFYRGLAYRAKGDFAAATADYNRCLDTADNSWYMRPRVTFFRGAAQAGSGDLNRAAGDFQPLIDVCFKEDAPNDYELRAVHRSDWEYAAQDCAAWIAQRPDSWQAYFCRGLLRRQLEDWQGMKQDYAGAVQRAPNNPRLRDWEQSQAILINGVPNPYRKEKLPPGTTFCNVYDQMDDNLVVQVYYDAQVSQPGKQFPLSESQALRAKLRDEGWLYLKFEANKEGHIYTYWKPQ